MKPLLAKVRPASGFARAAHLGLSALLPILVLVLVRIDLAPAAMALILLSKWRMLAVKPRFWLAHIRTNAVDIITSLSFLVFMTETNSFAWQIGFTVLFIIWLTVIKPMTGSFMIGVQALIGFTLGLTALFIIGGEYPLIALVISTGFVAYTAAHHFLDAFEEKYARLLSYVWGWFSASLVWVLGHWLLYYADGLVAQPVMLLVSIGFGLAALYYLDHKDRLTNSIGRQFIFIMVAITVIILTFSDWGDKVV
jgi:hypothetical protein